MFPTAHVTSSHSYTVPLSSASSLSHFTHFALLLLRGRGNAGKVLDDLLGVLCLSSTRLTTVIEEEKEGGGGGGGGGGGEGEGM